MENKLKTLSREKLNLHDNEGREKKTYAQMVNLPETRKISESKDNKMFVELLKNLETLNKQLQE